VFRAWLLVSDFGFNAHTLRLAPYVIRAVFSAFAAFTIRLVSSACFSLRGFTGFQQLNALFIPHITMR